MIYFNWPPGPFLATQYDMEPGGAGFEAMKAEPLQETALLEQAGTESISAFVVQVRFIERCTLTAWPPSLRHHRR